MQVGRFRRVLLREIWGRESSGFTKWLTSNMDLVEEVTGLRLSLLEREKKAGSLKRLERAFQARIAGL
jgi:hypothetical protein